MVGSQPELLLRCFLSEVVELELLQGLPKHSLLEVALVEIVGDPQLVECPGRLSVNSCVAATSPTGLLDVVVALGQCLRQLLLRRAAHELHLFSNSALNSHELMCYLTCALLLRLREDAQCCGQ